MGRKRRWHSIRRDGPGRMRIRIASMLKKDLDIEIDPYDIFQNNYPQARLLDLCRWGGRGTKDGRYIHVCCWDRMGDVIKRGTIEAVSTWPKDYLSFEVT